MTWHDQYHPMRGIRTRKYKYIKNLKEGPMIYMPLDIHKSLSGEEVQKEYYVANQLEELYDLENDPLENMNMADDAAYNDILVELREKVNQWMKETNDPLLQGDVEGIPSEGWKDEEEKGNTFKRKEGYNE